MSSQYHLYILTVYSLDEGETVIKTVADYWLVARKNGHRRFFVLFTQKDVNFAEVNGKRCYLDEVLFTFNYRGGQKNMSERI